MSTKERPDQARDRDTIRRDTITAELSYGFVIVVRLHPRPAGEPLFLLELMEPSTSANTASPKFEFIFDDRKALDSFVAQVNSEATLAEALAGYEQEG